MKLQLIRTPRIPKFGTYPSLSLVPQVTFHLDMYEDNVLSDVRGNYSRRFYIRRIESLRTIIAAILAQDYLPITIKTMTPSYKVIPTNNPGFILPGTGIQARSSQGRHRVGGEPEPGVSLPGNLQKLSHATQPP